MTTAAKPSLYPAPSALSTPPDLTPAQAGAIVNATNP